MPKGKKRNDDGKQPGKIRTTVYLEPSQHRALKVYAAQNAIDMSAVIAHLLKKAGIE